MLTQKEGPMIYRVAIHRTKEGINLCIPAMPGFWSEGETKEKALVNIPDAIRE
jgi:predicted RNase H-like HicB family nuclease